MPPPSSILHPCIKELQGSNKNKIVLKISLGSPILLLGCNDESSSILKFSSNPSANIGVFIAAGSIPLTFTKGANSNDKARVSDDNADLVVEYAEKFFFVKWHV